MWAVTIRPCRRSPFPCQRRLPPSAVLEGPRCRPRTCHFDRPYSTEPAGVPAFIRLQLKDTHMRTSLPGRYRRRARSSARAHLICCARARPQSGAAIGWAARRIVDPLDAGLPRARPPSRAARTGVSAVYAGASTAVGMTRAATASASSSRPTRLRPVSPPGPSSQREARCGSRA